MDLQFILNAIRGPVRRENLHGRPHLVAPMTMIVPGVLSGSKGALYYPEEEVGRDPSIWNGVPILHRHPELPRSGRDPIIIERQGLGHVYNSHTDHEGILRGEGWFDEGRTKQIAPEIHKRLDNASKGKNREPVELSTGLFTDNQPANNGAKCPKTGRSYQFIARNYKADHLAVFTDQRGACSIKDGCGVMNAEQERQLVLNEALVNVDTDIEEEEGVENAWSPASRAAATASRLARSRENFEEGRDPEHLAALHDNASQAHRVAALDALGKGNKKLALHHGLLASEHYDVATSHRNNDEVGLDWSYNPRSPKTSGGMRRRRVEHLQAAEHWGEGDKNEQKIASLHKKAASIYALTPKTNDPGEHGFLHAIKSNIHDDTTKKVYGDWLQDRGHEATARRVKRMTFNEATVENAEQELEMVLNEQTTNTWSETARQASAASRKVHDESKKLLDRGEIDHSLHDYAIGALQDAESQEHENAARLHKAGALQADIARNKKMARLHREAEQAHYNVDRSDNRLIDISDLGDEDNNDNEDDSELEHTSQRLEDGVTVAEFFVTLLHTATCAHLVHFQTRSFAAHMAMDELYKRLPKLVDALVECYQGCYGIVSYEGISGFTPPKGDSEEFVRQVVHYVKAYRHTVGPETQLQNLVDEIASELDRASYRTRFLS